MKDSSLCPMRAVALGLALIFTACATLPAPAPTAAVVNAAPISFAALQARQQHLRESNSNTLSQRAWQKIWASQNVNQLHDHLNLKLTQIQSSFAVEKEALQEFDQALAQSRNAEFLKQATETKALARIQGADIYRALAEDQLLEIVIDLECAAHGTRLDMRAVQTLKWLSARVSESDDLEKLALLPFAEKLLAQTGLNDSSAALTGPLIRASAEVVATERSSSFKKQVSVAGQTAYRLADRELKNWILHFTQSSAEIADEYQYFPTVVGRQHSFGVRKPASIRAQNQLPAKAAVSSIADGVQDRSAATGAHPLRPFSARNLSENEFAMIFEGQTHIVYTSDLASELIEHSRPATFFVSGSDLKSANDSHAKWLEQTKTRATLAFGAQGNTLEPVSLESDGELAQSIDRSLLALNLAHLPNSTFLKPSFDCESGRLGKIARERGLRLVRANIESFDQIDFDPQHVAQRIAQQTALLKSGIIRLQLGTPRAQEIQRELTATLHSSFKDANFGPHFVALTSERGGA